jgi:cell fate regulator YaaT (PSP1 superfamily)
MDVYDPSGFPLVEVSFKNGARKDIFHNNNVLDIVSGDHVVVDVGSGYDIGQVSLSGELVRMQMKKKGIREDQVLFAIVRKAHNRDLEKLDQSRRLEKSGLIRARAIARTLDLEMKVGDVEYRGDTRKATFYYTADGRIDFRELVREYAKEFRVKIEMRQIGARQESARIGGLGSCGRELCCSTWLTDFKSVTTNAARYQNISINQSKLSGQCGRLKCCLNYELDTYMDALKDFPKNVDVLHAESGTAHKIKIDIFKKIIYYSIKTNIGRGIIVAIDLERVKEIKKMNDAGKKPNEFVIQTDDLSDPNEEKDLEYADVTGQIELPNEPRRKSRRRKPRNRNRKQGSQGNQKKQSPTAEGKDQKTESRQKRKPTGRRNQPKSRTNQKQSNQGNPNQRKSGQGKTNQGKSNQDKKDQNK